MNKTLLRFPFLFLLLLLLAIPLTGAHAHASIGLEPTVSDAPATPGEIEGSQAVCAGSLAAYSINAVTGALYYTWTVPSGWFIVSGQGGTQIYVSPGANRGTISVRAANQYGESGDRRLEIDVIGMPSEPEAIIGPSVLCAHTKAVYQVQAARQDVSYIWDIPAGWVLSAGQGTGTIEVTPVSGGGVVRVSTRNQCGYRTETSKTVIVSSPISNNSISESQKICEGVLPNPLTGQVPVGGNGAYVYIWESSSQSATDGFAPAAGINNSQQYMPGMLTATTWFRRKVISGDCEHKSGAVQISLMPVPAKPAIERVHNTELRTTAQGKHFEWRRNGVLLALHGSTIQISEPGAYDVRVLQDDCFSPFSDVLEVKLAEETTMPDAITLLQTGRGQLTISAKEPMPKAELLLFNLQGREVYRKKLEQLKSITLELGPIPDGIYILTLEAPDLYLKQKVLLQR